MKWQNRRRSSNVNYSRNQRRSVSRGGRRMMPLPLSGGTLVLLIILILVFGGNPLDLLTTGAPAIQRTNVEDTAEVRELEDFLAVVLADTEDVWHEVFAEYGGEYREPTLQLYQQQVQSGCGLANSNMGPFYCPSDEGVYVDVSFYHELQNRFQAPGDFAFAYVLAHEVGHHIQNLMGTTDRIFALKGRMSEKDFNKYMVCLELQADYYAGVFAHYVQGKGYLEEGDIDEAINAAAAVGDDRIQEAALGRVIPDKFTHGSSEDRSYWFMRGLKYGDLEHGDTFNERGYPLPDF